MHRPPRFGAAGFLIAVVLAGCGGGNDPDPVPNVVGTSTKDASATLKDAGYEVLVTGRPKGAQAKVDAAIDAAVDCAGNAPELVTDQSPGAGLEAKQGSPVTIAVSRDC